MILSTLRSAFLLAALEFALSKGLEFCKNYTIEKEAEVEKFVKDLIPGEDFDTLGWGIVKSLLPKIFEIAEVLIDKIDGVENRHQRLAMMMTAIAKHT